MVCMETSVLELCDLPVRTPQGAVHSRWRLLQDHPCNESYWFQKRYFQMGISHSLTTEVSCVLAGVEFWTFQSFWEIKAFLSIYAEEVRLTDLIFYHCLPKSGSCLGHSKQPWGCPEVASGLLPTCLLSPFHGSERSAVPTWHKLSLVLPAKHAWSVQRKAEEQADSLLLSVKE